MLVGPIFSRELVTAPRRPKLFVYRTVYAAVLFAVMCTAWLILFGTQDIRNISDMSRFGLILFKLLAPLQLAIIAFFAALSTASSVAQEKDKKTLLLLLLTRLNSSELVLGKLFSSMLSVFVMLLAGLPVFATITLFGGVTFAQVVRVFWITLITSLLAGSLGSALAFWREKTFQTLASTAMGLVAFVLIGEAVALGLFGSQIGTLAASEISTWMSPVRAVIAAAQPDYSRGTPWLGDTIPYSIIALSLTVFINGIAIARCRVWNPSREIRQGMAAKQTSGEWNQDVDEKEQLAEQARQLHVDSQLRSIEKKPYREVWNNPVLWREVRTWAYGRKILLIRLAYVCFALLVCFGIYVSLEKTAAVNLSGAVIPEVAKPLLPLFILSLVIVNALAVTTVTTERDGKSIDLLLVTDLSPAEFLFGKLGGVFWVTKEMVLIPMLVCVGLWLMGELHTEGMVFLIAGLIVLNIFVAVLGIHCGMNHANSRSAITVSLGTVFFLFLGIATCIFMMISFSGSFNLQLYPFLAFILGGGVGLFVALGSRNPSSAIFIASVLLPFATFYALVSYFRGLPLAVFLTIAVAYSFTTAAMMIPALSEFDFAMGRGSEVEETP